MSDGVNIDFAALYKQMESQIVLQLLRQNSQLRPGQFVQMQEVLTIFAQHGVGAVEAMQILAQIGELFKEDSVDGL